jgi:Ca-activated chloride channel homolog
MRNDGLVAITKIYTEAHSLSARIFLTLVVSALSIGFVGLATPSIARSPAPLAATSAPPTQWQPPRIRLADSTAQPIMVREVRVRAEVFGAVARTQIEMRLANPNARVLEGELQFPLLDGQVVSGFALDINGALRDAVPVPKVRGQEIFEDIRRRGVDPALLEATAGNQYKLRIYPIPARGERRVLLTFSERLPTFSSQATLRIPLAYDGVVERLSVEVFGSGITEKELITDRSALDAIRTQHSTGASLRIERERWQAADTASAVLQVKLPVTERERILVGATQGKRYFAADVPFVDEPVRRAEPKHIALVWDASASASAQQGVLATLDAYFKGFSNGSKVSLLVVRNRVEPIRSFRISKGDWSALAAALRAEPFDGSSNFDVLPIAADVDLTLLVSDGLTTDGKREINYKHRAPLIAINGAVSADAPRLTRIAEASGGQFIDITKTTPIEGAAALRRDGWRIERIDSLGAESLVAASQTVRDGRLQVAGLLRDATTRVALSLRHPMLGKRNLEINVSDDAQNAKASAWAGQLWATWQVAALSDAPQLNATAMQRISAEHGIVGPNSSLIVLEFASDYAQYDLPAPADLRAEVDALRTRRFAAEQQTQSAHIERIVQQFNERQRWWERTYPKGDRIAVSEKKKFEGAVGAQQDRNVMPSPGFVPPREASAKAKVAPSAPVAAPAPAPPAAPMSSPAKIASGAAQLRVMRDAPSAPESDNADRSTREPSKRPLANASISLKAWSPDALYIARLRSANEGDLYRVYLDAREEYKSSSAFTLDVAAHFFERGKTELALRILSNLTEMNLENRQLLRLYAYRLNEAKQFALAIPVFERVAQLAPNEPQSWRDLGLAHADNGDSQQALDALWSTVSRPWHQRFAGVNMIALAEMNAVIANSKQTLKLTQVDPRLIRNMPLDLRIVMAWDTDDTDIDLWVDDPNGERSAYNNRLSFQGAATSPDATGGYGPEEFALREAKRGTYAIKAQFYGHRQQVLSAGTTVMVRVTTGFGSKSAKDQWLTLRLTSGRETARIGEVEIR